MMVPIQLTIIPLYLDHGVAPTGSTRTLAIILPAALFNAFGVFLLRQYVRGIPLELEEAAAIDGASRIKIFTTMILPLLRPRWWPWGSSCSSASGTTSSTR